MAVDVTSWYFQFGLLKLLYSKVIPFMHRASFIHSFSIKLAESVGARRYFLINLGSNPVGSTSVRFCQSVSSEIERLSGEHTLKVPTVPDVLPTGLVRHY